MPVPSRRTLTRRKPSFAILAALGFLRRSMRMVNLSRPGEFTGPLVVMVPLRAGPQPSGLTRWSRAWVVPQLSTPLIAAVT
jgi:hypothetical protein